ncbi:GNAT family N-acetyltransferase [Vibrio sp. SCSIO 43137]|uniref:GNAT family N-acetyltransferase n=1 Tax=Vibrio sp. SCSIO 43137 TaxID=3021011 RepID=UPI002307CEA6|nr:GNAT family N-acetyltransferase [Vibrio sp. SCSIO 43137]WCE32469.1 GNAT family N-acetyltransferase [Vibrio sp. SCSIO 43137]
MAILSYKPKQPKLSPHMKVENLTQHPHLTEEIARWHYNEWHSLYPESTFQEFVQDIEHCLNEEAVPATRVLLDSDKVVGSASVLKQDMTTNQHLSPWLANVYISPEHRGKGLGSILIEQVMKQVQQTGIETLYLFTEDQACFYKRLGWQLLKQENYSGAEVSIMAADLREAN